MGIFLKKQVLKDSITAKQNDIGAIKAASDQATKDYSEAYRRGRNADEVKNLRWKALQTWYDKFSLHGTGNAMTSMRYFCTLLINEDGLNGDLGNYVTQYDKYGKYAFDWDVDRVAFLPWHKKS